MPRVEEKFDIKFIDPSGLSTFSRCPFKFMCERCMGLSQPDKMRIALDYGTCMHSALPYCYNGEKYTTKAMEMFNRNWIKFSHGESDGSRNMLSAEKSLRKFASDHDPSVNPYIPQKIEIKAELAESIDEGEVPFLIDIGGSLSLAGRIDLVVKWKSSNRYWVLDFKTSSEVSPRYFNNFWNCVQALGYTLAGSQILNEDVQGLIVEAIRTSEKNVENQMFPVFVQRHQLESFLEFAKRQTDLIMMMNEIQEWPKNPSGCAPYGMFGTAGYVCEYQTICNLPDWNEGVRYYNRGEPFSPFKITA